MGIAPIVMADFRRFVEQGFLRPGDRMAEIGSQEIHCHADVSAVTDMFQTCGIKTPPAEHLARLAQGGSSRELFTMLGYRYTSFDIDGMFGALQYDLNFDTVPGELQGVFDLVTNFGTTEHLANQISAFRFIHDLTRPGGYMYHVVPFTGYVNHGLINYTPKFFWMLCRSNDYALTSMKIHVQGEKEYLNQDILASVHCDKSLDEFSHQDSCLIVLLQKVHAADFVPPVDGDLTKSPEHIRSNYPSIPSLQNGERQDDLTYAIRQNKNGPYGTVRSMLRKLFRPFS